MYTEAILVPMLKTEEVEKLKEIKQSVLGYNIDPRPNYANTIFFFNSKSDCSKCLPLLIEHLKKSDAIRKDTHTQVATREVPELPRIHLDEVK